MDISLASEIVNSKRKGKEINKRRDGTEAARNEEKGGGSET